jgi:hypothetical protein
MVAVDHEVRLAELHRDDRRKGPVGERALEGAHPVAAEAVEWAKIARERAGAAVGPDEGVERDGADTEVSAPERLQSPLDPRRARAAGPHDEPSAASSAAGCQPSSHSIGLPYV